MENLRSLYIQMLVKDEYSDSLREMENLRSQRKLKNACDTRKASCRLISSRLTAVPGTNWLTGHWTLLHMRSINRLFPPLRY
jgi:hypothetical protein